MNGLMRQDPSSATDRRSSLGDLRFENHVPEQYFDIETNPVASER
jgi:hypothetical protein